MNIKLLETQKNKLFNFKWYIVEYPLSQPTQCTGLARNKFTTLEGSRMRSIGPNEIKFELQIIQMTRFPFIKKTKQKQNKFQNSPKDGTVTQTVFICISSLFYKKDPTYIVYKK